MQAPGGRIQGGEELVRSQDPLACRGAAESVEQGALAGVGVAHQGQPFPF